MIKSAQALCRFDGPGMLTENIPIGLFRFDMAAEDVQASCMMAPIKRFDRAVDERQFDQVQRNLRAVGM